MVLRLLCGLIPQNWPEIVNLLAAISLASNRQLTSRDLIQQPNAKIRIKFEVFAAEINVKKPDRLTEKQQFANGYISASYQRFQFK